MVHFYAWGADFAPEPEMADCAGNRNYDAGLLLDRHGPGAGNSNIRRRILDQPVPPLAAGAMGPKPFAAPGRARLSDASAALDQASDHHCRHPGRADSQKATAGLYDGLSHGKRYRGL